MTKTSARYSPEVRARAVRMVLDHQAELAFGISLVTTGRTEDGLALLKEAPWRTDRTGALYFAYAGDIVFGRALAAAGQVKEGLDWLRERIESFERIGTLLPSPKGRDYPVLRTTEPETRYLEWRGSEARAYIRACAQKKRASRERRLQRKTIRELSASPTYVLLRNLQPVRPANCLMEIPAAVRRGGCVGGTGNIDILARTGRER